MANINAHLPASIAAAFHPPTENLLHDNLVRPVIPKPEIISSYTKLHEDHEHAQLSSQSRHIIQEDDKHKHQDDYQESSSDKRRNQFFIRREKALVSEPEIDAEELGSKQDFERTISVIQARYNDSVHPFPNPTISFSI